MERNDDLPGGRGVSGDGGESGEAGNAGQSGGMSASGAGSSDRVREALGGARERLADVGSTMKDRAADVGGNLRDKAGNAKNSLADMLESGADKIRQRAHGTNVQGAPAYAGVSGEGGAVSGDGRTTQMGNRVAGGMQATADWLREADMDSMKTGLERQVKEHPGRTLLIALGVGYLLGKAFRK